MRVLSRVWSPRLAATTLSILLAIGGIVALVVAYAERQTPPPQPSAAIAGRVEATSTTKPPPKVPANVAPATTTTTTSGLRPSPPVEISIPSIGVQSAIVDLGQNADGTVQVPTSFHIAGWYKYGVTPGQNGPSVFLGHVDSQSGPGIFYRLGALHSGDRVLVTRQDGQSVTFVITGVRQYSKVAFPTIDVYGDTSEPTIRLVTCGGAFDSRTHHYLSNIVAFGKRI